MVAGTAILLILGSEPNARYLYPALPLLFVPFAALLGWAAAHQRLLARSLLAFAIACAALNAYFLPASSYYHKDFYGPFTPRQREAYLGVTAPIRNAIAWFNAPIRGRGAADAGQLHRRARRRRLRESLAPVQYDGPDPARLRCAASAHCSTDGRCDT